MRSIAVGLALMCFTDIASATDKWTFVWVGATAERQFVVEGTAVSKIEDGQLRFELTGPKSERYMLDTVIAKGGSAEAGFAGIGDSYRGVTYLKGQHTKQLTKKSEPCGIELIQVQNDFNSISVKRAGLPKC